MKKPASSTVNGIAVSMPRARQLRAPRSIQASKSSRPWPGAVCTKPVPASSVTWSPGSMRRRRTRSRRPSPRSGCESVQAFKFFCRNAAKTIQRDLSFCGRHPRPEPRRRSAFRPGCGPKSFSAAVTSVKPVGDAWRIGDRAIAGDRPGRGRPDDDSSVMRSVVQLNSL